MTLPVDITARVRADFPLAESTVTDLLQSYAGREPHRIMRCLLYLAQGSLDRLHHELNTAAVDYRDTISFAEYDASGQRLRDFSLSFDAD